MDERRRLDDKNWEEIRSFISESREYRIKDELLQKDQIRDIESLNNKVGIQNGRVVKIEQWKIDIENQIKRRKDNYSTAQAMITVIATIVMAVSAMVMIFKK